MTHFEKNKPKKDGGQWNDYFISFLFLKMGRQLNQSYYLLFFFPSLNELRFRVAERRLVGNEFQIYLIYLNISRRQFSSAPHSIQIDVDTVTYNRVVRKWCKYEGQCNWYCLGTYNWLCRTELFECGAAHKWWDHSQMFPLLGILTHMDCFGSESLRLWLESGHYYFSKIIWNEETKKKRIRTVYAYGRHENLHATHKLQRRTTRAVNGKNDNELMCGCEHYRTLQRLRWLFLL